MIYAGFTDLEAAKEHRSKHGGWIFSVLGGNEFIWFAITETPSKIFTHHAVSGLNGTLI